MDAHRLIVRGEPPRDFTSSYPYLNPRCCWTSSSSQPLLLLEGLALALKLTLYHLLSLSLSPTSPLPFVSLSLFLSLQTHMPHATTEYNARLLSRPLSSPFSASSLRLRSLPLNIPQYCLIEVRRICNLPAHWAGQSKLVTCSSVRFLPAPTLDNEVVALLHFSRPVPFYMTVRYVAQTESPTFFAGIGVVCPPALPPAPGASALVSIPTSRCQMTVPRSPSLSLSLFLFTLTRCKM